MIELKGIGGHRKLLVERYQDFRAILQREGSNVFSAGTETRNYTTYFRVVLKK